jgi:probable HAF family extracellular repeat protein
MQYRVTTIPLATGSEGVTISAINNRGQVAGSFTSTGGPVSNFLYTPGTGLTNLERTGPPSLANFQGSRVAAINSTGQILLASGLLYSPDRPVQDLAPAIRAAYPDEPNLTFVSLNDRGMVSGTSVYPGSPGGYTQHVFRYAPGGSAGITTVTYTTSNRLLSQGPFVMDDASNVIYSEGFPPGSATIFTAAGVTQSTGCGVGNGWATSINNASQIGGGWGRMAAFPTICTLDPSTLRGVTTVLVDDSDLRNAGFVRGLNNRGDAVGYRGGLSSGTASLFTNGEVLGVTSLFPTGSGWVALTADRINDAGEIAGTGTLNGAPAAYVLTPVPDANYSARMLCSQCVGRLLSDSGLAVWVDGTSGRHAVSSPRGVTTFMPESVAIFDINNSGTIVGSDTIYGSGGYSYPLVATAPYTQFENLNPVFGWQQGVATSINDGNDVVGYGPQPGSFGPLFADPKIAVLVGINNAGQVIGRYFDTAYDVTGFLYTPGRGFQDLAYAPFSLPNTGHMLAFSRPSSTYSIEKPDGVIPLPPGFSWVSINDRDEVVGICPYPRPACAVYYSVDRGLVSLTVPGRNIQPMQPVFINNAGQILVNVMSADNTVPEVFILTPGGVPSQGSSLPITPDNRLPNRTLTRRSAAQKTHKTVRSVNGAPVPPTSSAPPD